jgi:hypothetical protein
MEYRRFAEAITDYIDHHTRVCEQMKRRSIESFVPIFNQWLVFSGHELYTLCRIRLRPQGLGRESEMIGWAKNVKLSTNIGKVAS